MRWWLPYQRSTDEPTLAAAEWMYDEALTHSRKATDLRAAGRSS
jgi:hypothetical protein